MLCAIGGFLKAALTDCFEAVKNIPQTKEALRNLEIVDNLHPYDSSDIIDNSSVEPGRILLEKASFCTKQLVSQPSISPSSPYLNTEEQEIDSQVSKNTFFKSLDLEFEVGKKYNLVGAEGSGKSTLILALIGEMPVLSGLLQISGRIAYCTEEPLIIHANIRENILFGREFEDLKFKEVISFCQLQEEFDAYGINELTLVDSKFDNITKQVAQKIALARTVYSEADIYVFDNSLSSLEGHETGRIFASIVEGRLTDKTVLMASVDSKMPHLFDFIVTLEHFTITSIIPSPERVSQSQDSTMLFLNKKTSGHSIQNHNEIIKPEYNFSIRTDKRSARNSLAAYLETSPPVPLKKSSLLKKDFQPRKHELVFNESKGLFLRPETYSEIMSKAREIETSTVKIGRTSENISVDKQFCQLEKVAPAEDELSTKVPNAHPVKLSDRQASMQKGRMRPRAKLNTLDVLDYKSKTDILHKNDYFKSLANPNESKREGMLHGFSTKGIRSILLFVLFWCFYSASLILLYQWLGNWAFDQSVKKSGFKSQDTAIVLAISILIAILAKSFLIGLSYKEIEASLLSKIVDNLRRRSIGHLERLPAELTATHVQENLEMIDEFAAMGLSSFSSAIIQTITLFMMVATVLPFMIPVIAVYALFCSFAIRRLLRFDTKLQKVAHLACDDLDSSIETLCRGFEIIRSYKLQDHFKKRFLEMSNAHSNVQLHSEMACTWSASRIGLAVSIFQACLWYLATTANVFW